MTIKSAFRMLERFLDTIKLVVMFTLIVSNEAIK